MDKTRLLNFDDLYLLRYLLDGLSLTAIARELKLTQPAITQRVRKIEDVFGCDIFRKSGRSITLTKEGHDICSKASDVLKIMTGLSQNSTDYVVNVGTRPEAGRSWLWPAIKNLRKKHPNITFHIHFGSGQEILSQLGAGKLDVVLTSAPTTSKNFRSHEIVKESYVMVASPAVAKSIKTPKDLANQILIEHDRSFPFQRYLDAKSKSKISYKDVWFLESTEIMADALVRGYGVGIIPQYLADPRIKKKQLQKINLPVKIDFDQFRLVYRADRFLDDSIEILANELRDVGLR